MCDPLRRMRADRRENALSGIALLVCAVMCLVFMIMSAPLAEQMNAKFLLLRGPAACTIDSIEAPAEDDCEDDVCKGIYVRASMASWGQEESKTKSAEFGTSEADMSTFGVSRMAVSVIPLVKPGFSPSQSGGGNKLGLELMLGELEVGETYNCWYEDGDCKLDDCVVTLSTNIGSVAMTIITVMWALFLCCCGGGSIFALSKSFCCGNQ